MLRKLRLGQKNGFFIKRTCISLDISQGFQYASGIKYARVLNMQRYSYNNIIINVTNVIILEFLSTRFAHADAPQLTILYETNES